MIGHARPQLVVLVGPSGVGKDTVLKELGTKIKNLWVSVSVTTRPPRPGEVDGVSYDFISDEEFDAMVSVNELLEWAEYAGARYGTPKAPIDLHIAQGNVVVLEIELAGARQVRANAPQARYVLLAPPSIDELRRRLANRGTESPQEQEARLEKALVELAASDEFDAVIVNDTVEQAAEDLLAFMTS
jgi:guanylate kinase